MNETENKSTFWPQFFVWAAVIGFCAFVASVEIRNFIRVRAFNPGACINNLRQIDSAKNVCAFAIGKTNGVLTANDIKPYIKLDSDGNLPKCPSGGTYIIGKIGEPPACSIGGPGHSLR